MYYIIGDIGNTSTRICLLNKSKISEELTTTIIRKAALLQVEDKNKKK